MSGEIDCNPLYRITRLNGMPIQMLAMITATSDQLGEVSQLMWPICAASRKELITPESLFIIHDHVDADTSSGSSHGTRKSARRRPLSGKCRKKNTASASPMENWNTIDTTTNNAVFSRAGANVAF